MTEIHPDQSSRTLWNRMTFWSGAHPGAAFALAALITLVSLFLLPSIPFKTDPTDYVPVEDPVVKHWWDMTHRFGALDLLMVGLEEAEKPMSPEGLGRLTAITKALEERKAEGILLARSLTNVGSLQEDEDGTLHAGLLLDAIPRTEAKYKEMRERILADTKVTGALISEDQMGYMILVRIDPKKNVDELAGMIRDIVNENKGPMKAVFFGAPFITNMVSGKVFEALPWFAPLFALAFLVIVIPRVRNIRALIVILASTVWPILWAGGVMAMFGLELSPTAMNAVLAVLLLGVVTFARGTETWLNGPSRNTNPFPRRMAALLAAAGISFLALPFSSLKYLDQFGEAAAVGVFSLIGFGLLVFVPLVKMLPQVRTATASLDAAPKPLRMKRNTFRALFAALMLFGAVGLGNIRFYMQPAEMFGSDDEVGQAIDFFNRRFKGSDFLQIHAVGDLRDPAAMKRLMRLTDLLEGTGMFSDVKGITQVVGFLGKQFGGLHRIPGDREALGNLWFFLEGDPDVQPLVSDNRDEAMMAARIPAGSSLPSAAWRAIAEEAGRQSAETGREAARLRLSSMAKRYGLKRIDENRIGDILDRAEKPEPADSRRIRDKALADVHAYMVSEDAPFEPTAEEWPLLVRVLDREGGPSKEALAAAIGGLKTFQEEEYPPDVAEQVGQTLQTRLNDSILKQKSRLLAEELSREAVTDVPKAFTVRAAGVFADFLDGEDAPGELKLVVSGFPAIAERLESTLFWGTFGGTVAVWMVFGVLVWLFRRDRIFALRAILDAFLVLILTFAFGWLFGIHMDSSSATLYLVSPVLAFVLSPWLLKPSPGTAPLVGSFAPTFALAFAAGLATFVFIGIAPVMRLGGIMALSLVLVCLLSLVSQRLVFANGENTP